MHGVCVVAGEGIGGDRERFYGLDGATEWDGWGRVKIAGFYVRAEAPTP